MDGGRLGARENEGWDAMGGEDAAGLGVIGPDIALAAKGNCFGGAAACFYSFFFLFF